MGERRGGGRWKREGVPDLGNRINNAMGNSLSGTELSAKSGVSQAYLSRLINGQITNPSIDILMRVSNGLGLTVSELIGEVERDTRVLKGQQIRLQEALGYLEAGRAIIEGVIYKREDNLQS